MIDIDNIAKSNAGEFDESGGMYFTRKAWGFFVHELRELFQRQASAARTGMDAAKRGATILYAEAAKARAESSPDVLASERAMNAMLTEENEMLRAEINNFTTQCGELNEEVVRLRAFHEFFRDRCEGLFAQFGMAGVDAYNEAAREMS